MVDGERDGGRGERDGWWEEGRDFIFTLYTLTGKLVTGKCIKLDDKKCFIINN